MHNSLAYYVMVKEGPKNSAEMKFQIQAESYKLILRRKICFYTQCVFGGEKSPVLTSYTNKNLLYVIMYKVQKNNLVWSPSLKLHLTEGPSTSGLCTHRGPTLVHIII